MTQTIPMSFLKFQERLKTIMHIVNTTNLHEEYLEDFFERIKENDISITEVCTGDVAQVTLPCMTMKRKVVYENYPTSLEATAWINQHKSEFKKKYGTDWEQILKNTAWNIFPE